MNANGEWVDIAHEDFEVIFDKKSESAWPALKMEYANGDVKRKRDALIRLALHKKPHGIGAASVNAYMEDIASDLSEYCAVAIELACVHLRRTQESPFFPTSKMLRDTAAIIQNAIRSLVISNSPVNQIENHGASSRMAAFYKTPQDNPIRRELCDFLIQHGEPDYFDCKTSMRSNYNLESLAKSKYGWSKTS